MLSKSFLFKILTIIFIMTELIFAQDWPNLGRFKNQDNSLGLPKQDENRVVFMGNSITEEWIKKRPEFFAGSSYVNRGISGQTTPQILIRFRQDVVNLKPKVVVILAGTNDIAGNTGPSTLEMIMDNLKSMTEIAGTNNIKVILCSVLPAFDYPWRAGMKPNVKIPLLNKMIKDYADKNDITYLDYFTAMVDDNNGMQKEFSEDGVHPNVEGYKVMEPLVEKAIKKALNQ